ncbi:MAG: selenium-dependent xanthine dehydrogenase [Thermoanaerobaculaceae bacterium]|nr:selenium-dependent xanthine dehydrogenase [Thermoanaerobaculaceae bacterium]MDI9620676.1 selenium-dependent xanthine dehydrogenase [Acidobacteriota bacterium]NLH10285.1 selenium-dependent xanthine dehydrogenase [Holophagae bacterium]
MAQVELTVNGVARHLEPDDGETLLQTLRERLGLVAAKVGCSQGYCGACTVLLEGSPALACMLQTAKLGGRRIVTLEGLPDKQRQLLARAFVQEGAVQCGYCTPGLVMRTHWLVDKGRTSDRDAVVKALGSHMCRCTGYLRVLDAISTAGEAAATGGFTTAEPRRVPRFAAPRHQGCRSSKGVGTSQPRYRGEQLALGEKPFIGDLRCEGMLHGAVVLAAHPRARVLGIDAAPALAMSGVARVLTAADVPGQRLLGTVVRDWPAFVAVGELTRCVGDVLALVVADTQHRAYAAAAAVQVDYEVLEPVTSPEQALAAGAPELHASGNILETCAFQRGDVDAALATSAHTVKARFQTQRIEHAFMEPEACLARPQGKGLKVYSQGQGVHEDQAQIAALLNLPVQAVDVELVSTGGGFGGKEDLAVQGQTALAAYLLQRPVRTVLTREQSILLHPKRHPLTLDYEAGCDTQGRLTAVRARIVGDTGAYASVGAQVLERAAGHSCGPYRVPNVEVEATTVYTNNPPSGAMRGFGANQAAFAIEGVLDMLAERVGLDRYDIRERNLLRPGDRFATGQIMTASCAALPTLEAVRDAFRQARVAGIACGIKNTGIGNGMNDTGRVAIRVRPDGTLLVLTGYTEMGQGLHTILRQVVAQETGLDPSCMEVMTRSEPEVECGMTTASRATALTTMAGQRAAVKLAEALRSSSLTALAGREFLGEYVCDVTVKPGTPTDNPVTHMTFGYAAQVVILDDQGRIAKVVAAHDVGRAINPVQCAQQIEGAIHMGIGYALTEDLPCEGGRPLSTRMRDLGILPAAAMPEVEVILLEVPDPVGGYGAKGVGEIGLVPTAGAVASALWAYDGVRRTTLPMRDAPAARSVRT